MKEEISLSKNDSAIENLVIRWWGKKREEKKKTHFLSSFCVSYLFKSLCLRRKVMYPFL
jgi:hypothetical protein